jgi:hypothetical protein
VDGCDKTALNSPSWAVKADPAARLAFTSTLRSSPVPDVSTYTPAPRSMPKSSGSDHSRLASRSVPLAAPILSPGRPRSPVIGTTTASLPPSLMLNSISCTSCTFGAGMLLSYVVGVGSSDVV